MREVLQAQDYSTAEVEDGMIRQLEENSVELGQAGDELRNLNQELERRVGERTNESAAKNAGLELRTEVLARSNADLVQFAYAHLTICRNRFARWLDVSRFLSANTREN